MADLSPDDLVPMQLGTLIGQSRPVPLPVLDQAYYTGDRGAVVPNEVTPELAELVGYFMGAGTLQSGGLRFRVDGADLDVVERLQVLGKELFALEPTVAAADGHFEVLLTSVRVARWWQAAGFRKDRPGLDHTGQSWAPRIPSAILETNDGEVYGGFLRGLFEADGMVVEGVPSVTTASRAFAAELRTLLLTVGVATTTRAMVGGFGSDLFQVRLRNVDHALRFDERIGFLGRRKNELVVELDSVHAGNRDRIALPRPVWDDMLAKAPEYRSKVLNSVRRHGGVPRQTAEQLFPISRDSRLAYALGYLFERVASNADGGVQPTFDLSVPENVTYVAGGFVSHNTIGFMMDCDTTGIEPDFSLVKFKKLVGGGSMQIVNQTIPRALKRLGYPDETVGGHRRVHRRARTRHRRSRAAAGALRGVRYRDGPTGDQADGPRTDDGGRAAVPVRRDLQDGEPARVGHGGGDLRGLRPGLEAGAQGAGGLPRQLQGRPAAQRRQVRQEGR